MHILEKIVAAYARIPGTEAVAMGGSRSTRYGGADSDIDLYVYSVTEIGTAERASIPARTGAVRTQLDNRVWEPGDEWIAADGTHIDVMFRRMDWIEDQLARVLDRHEASTGYSTCFWANVLYSKPLFDRSGWFAALQDRARQPYPEALRRAIVAKNHPILRDTLSSYRHQIERAVARGDAVALNHRTSALLASCFDILFAVNRQPHPGEKRLLQGFAETCPRRPQGFAERVTAVLDQPGYVAAVDALLDGLDALLADEGLMPAKSSHDAPAC